MRLHYIFKKIPGKKSVAVLSLIFDRIMGLMGVFVTIGIIVFSHLRLFRQQQELFYLLLICAIFFMSVLALLIAFIMLPQRMGIGGWLTRHFSHKSWIFPIISFFDALHVFRVAKIALLQCLIISVSTQILIVSAILIIAKMLGFPLLAFSYYAVAIGIAQIINLIPITPGGIGVGEMAFANIMLLFHPGIGMAFATIFFVYRLISMMTYFSGVIFYIPTFLFVKKRDHLQEGAL